MGWLAAVSPVRVAAKTVSAVVGTGLAAVGMVSEEVGMVWVVVVTVMAAEETDVGVAVRVMEVGVKVSAAAAKASEAEGMVSEEVGMVWVVRVVALTVVAAEEKEAGVAVRVMEVGAKVSAAAARASGAVGMVAALVVQGAGTGLVGMGNLPSEDSQ